MSIQVMDWVWRFSPERGPYLLLLLAIADFAHDDGGGAFPSVATLALKTRAAPREVYHLLGGLKARGRISYDYKKGPHGTNLYRIVMLDPAINSIVQDISQCKDLRETLQPVTVNPATDCTETLQPIAPKPLLTVNRTVKEPLDNKRAKPLPIPKVKESWPDFLSRMKLKYPSVVVDDEVESCQLYWEAKGKEANRYHVMNWLKNAVKYQVANQEKEQGNGIRTDRRDDQEAGEPEGDPRWSVVRSGV